MQHFILILAIILLTSIACDAQCDGKIIGANHLRMEGLSIKFDIWFLEKSNALTDR